MLEGMSGVLVCAQFQKVVHTMAVTAKSQSCVIAGFAPRLRKRLPSLASADAGLHLLQWCCSDIGLVAMGRVTKVMGVHWPWFCGGGGGFAGAQCHCTRRAEGCKGGMCCNVLVATCMWWPCVTLHAVTVHNVHTEPHGPACRRRRPRVTAVAAGSSSLLCSIVNQP